MRGGGFITIQTDAGDGISLSFFKEVCFSSLARRARYDRHAVEVVAGAVRRGRETDLSSFLFFQVFFLLPTD